MSVICHVFIGARHTHCEDNLLKTGSFLFITFEHEKGRVHLGNSSVSTSEWHPGLRRIGIIVGSRLHSLFLRSARKDGMRFLF